MLPFGMDSDLRFAATSRGRSLDGRFRPGIRYPSPFFDIGHTYLPPNLKALLRWCRYYYFTSSIINAAVTKMASYPLTDLLFESPHVGVREKWNALLVDKLRVKDFMYCVGLDYFTYGNAFVSVVFPFRKHLTCKSCGHTHLLEATPYKFRNLHFEATCQRCNASGVMGARDVYYRSEDEIRLVRWNPEDIDLPYHAYSGEARILYSMPPQIANDIKMGKPHVVESVPQIYIDSVRTGYPIHLQNVYHFKRPSISETERNMPWGLSMILPVLKDAYYMQMLRKAQEMIAQEHIVPMRVLFPSAGSATSDAYSTLSLADWRSKIETEVDRWKLDQNHIPVFPIPIGNQTLGGDGRALLLSQELRQVEESIIAGLQVPVEFVMGGLSYGGTSLAMHLLKSSLESYRTMMEEMLRRYLIPRIARHMQWEICPVRLQRFHMPDDLQRASLALQMNQAGKISDRTLLAELGYSQEREALMISEESTIQLKNMAHQQESQAHMQGKQMRIQQKYQALAMSDQQGLEPIQAMPPAEILPSIPIGLTQPIIDRDQYARDYAKQLAGMDEAQRFANLKLIQPMPELHAAVMRELNALSPQRDSSMKPLPAERPPNRSAIPPPLR